ncbi:MAG: hypothetical protein ACRED8_05025 [Caulobacteraceae bacterium]
MARAHQASGPQRSGRLLDRLFEGGSIVVFLALLAGAIQLAWLRLH